MTEKRFPVLGSPDGQPKSVPWHLVEPHRKQAEKNHSQTLERLAERGGLSWAELFAAMAGVSPFAIFGTFTKKLKELTMVRAEEFLWDEIPPEYRASIPGTAASHKAYDDEVKTARLEERAEKLFNEKYAAYYDPGWDEVSEKCRTRFRGLAKKQLNI